MIYCIFPSFPLGLLTTLVFCASLQRTALRSQDTTTRYVLLVELVIRFGSRYLDIAVCRLRICSYNELGLTRFTGPNPTVSGLPSSSTLMALLTSPLQSCRAITHSSWFLPVMSISCKEDNTMVSMFQTKVAPKFLWIF